MTGIVIEEFKAVTRNSLRGFARARMPTVSFFTMLESTKRTARAGLRPRPRR